MCDGLSKKKKRSILSRAKRLLAADIVHDATHKIKFFFARRLQLVLDSVCSQKPFCSFSSIPLALCTWSKRISCKFRAQQFFLVHMILYFLSQRNFILFKLTFLFYFFVLFSGLLCCFVCFLLLLFFVWCFNLVCFFKQKSNQNKNQT